MADSFLKFPIGTNQFRGYRSDPDVIDPSYLAPPSINCLVTKDGKAVSRMGYQAEFSIGVTGSAATSFYHKTYDIAFFALGTKVYYRDFATGATYDTGLTLTTGTVTRFTEFFGDIYLTNTTDGPRRIVCGRINGAATAGAKFLYTDADFAARLQVFGNTSGSLRINGTAEGFTNTGIVSGAADNGAGLIRITSSAAQGIQTGDNVTIAAVTGTTEANGTWTVTRIDSTHFDLQSSAFSNMYSAGGTWALNANTGNLSLTTTLSASYADNTVVIFVHDISGVVGIEKPSKIEIWKTRLHLMGFPNPANADQPNNSVIAGQFVIGQTGATGIEKIIDFTYGTGGSTKITVGSGGRTTNILGVDENLWFFNEDKTFAAAAADVNAQTPSTSSPGSALGLTIPIQKDPNHGCINEDCAIAIGNGEMSYVTNDRRIVRQSISTVSGAAVSFADEHYDQEISEHLKNMDKDQTGAIAFNYRGASQAIYQLRIQGRWYWFIYDHKILRNVGGSFVYGAWQPPQLISPVTSFFERDGVLYGTDATTDTVYSFFTAFSDNLSAIPVTIATCDFNVGNAMIGMVQAQGEINEPAQINMLFYVTNETGGRRSGSIKLIDGSSFSYSEDKSVGALPVGGSGSVAETTEIARWKKSFRAFPSQALRSQLILTNEQDGGYVSLISFSVDGRQFLHTFSASI